MDFHTLSRRELQALCKKNKIPANITNVAMIDALNALESVEGIEEILNPSESETAKSSMESPEKSERTSPNVLRTGCTTTRSRRTTRKVLAGEMETETPAAAVAAQSTRRRAAATSSRRKIEMPSNESEEVVENFSQTPATRRRAVKETAGSVRNAYSTRRSVRLAEKTVEQKPRSEAIKIDSFAEQVDVKMEETVDNDGFDVKEKSSLSDNGGIKEEKTNDMEIDAACDDNKAEGITETTEEIDREMSDKSDVLVGDNVDTLLGVDNGVQENHGSDDSSMFKTENATENDVKLDMDKYEGSDSVIVENLDNKVPAFDGSVNITVDNIPCETEDQSESEDGNTSYSDDVVDAQQIVEDEINIVAKVDESNGQILDDVVSANQFNQEEDHIIECENPIKDEIISENDVLGAESYAGSETADNVVLVSFAPPLLDFKGASTLAADVSFTQVKNNSISTTPLKKSPVKTPKTASRMTIISDFKENVDESGSKLILPKEKPMKIKEITGTDDKKSLEEFSLRQLTKMFKEKLDINQKRNTSKADDMETNPRPALKALSDNYCLVGGVQELKSTSA